MMKSCIVVVALLVAPPVVAQTQDDFFNPEVLQRIELWLNESDWAKLKANFQENTYYPADITWNGITVRSVGIRSRGLGSRRSQKPGLRVDFDRYSAGQQFLGLKSFVLDNLSQDFSGIKETVTMRFFTRLGIPAPRETHARVYINGRYAGLYAVVESVDKTMMGRVFGAINGNIQNDGYLFEYNYVLDSPWRFGYEGSALTPYRVRFDIKTNESHAESRIWGPIEELVRLVGQRNAGRPVRADDQSAARSGGVRTLHRGAELRRARRRVQRLCRHEQLLFLSPRRQHQPRLRRVGRRRGLRGA
jgi:spore coat protein CotH